MTAGRLANVSNSLWHVGVQVRISGVYTQAFHFSGLENDDAINPPGYVPAGL